MPPGGTQRGRFRCPIVKPLRGTSVDGLVILPIRGTPFVVETDGTLFQEQAVT